MKTSRDNYNVLHINAAPGNPSTFWQRKDAVNKEVWYRNIYDADEMVNVIGGNKNSVNPSDYELKKTFWQKNKDLIMSVGIVIAVAGVVWFLTNPKQFKSVPRTLGIES